MKDEAPYVLEWVAWHYMIGFSDFLVYTNDCTDGTDLMLQRLEQLGIVKHEYNEVLRRGPHKSALKYALEHPLYKECDWAFVGDVDEFLSIHVGDGKLPDLRHAYPDADVIPVVWRMFSNNGLVEIPDGLITEQMTDAAPWPEADAKNRSGFIKTLFRADQSVEKLGLHRPFHHEDSNEIWSPRKPDESDKLKLSGDLGESVVQVNHYAVRSVKSFILKRHRGRANHTGHTIGFDYWSRWNTGGEQDRSVARHRDALRDAVDELLQDPILHALHHAAVDIHRQRVEEVLQEPETKAVFDAILDGQNALESASTPATVSAPDAAAPPSSGLATSQEAQAIIQSILDENALSRAPKRRALRRKMLDEVMPKGARCAEIGVWQGDFSAEILEITKPRELVLIDPWDLLAKKTDEHTHAQHASANKMRAKYDHIMNTIGRIPNCIVRKGFSAEVLETYPDNYFDWVYIDGNHMYDFVLQDILVSARKVRPGGIIAGDDLFWKRDDRMPVREAMREALRQLGEGFTQTRRGAQFIIHRA